MNVNNVQILGRLGADPELRFTPSGNACLNVRIATSERFTDRAGQKREETEWHRVVYWGKLAEQIAEMAFKGARVFVEGKLKTREWERDGQKQRTTEIVARYVIVIDKRGKDTTAHTPAEEAADAIPF